MLKISTITVVLKNMWFRSDIQPVIARSIFALFVLMQLNLVVFRHAHRLSNGKIITHAHPYKPVDNSPYQPNNHTANELYLLDQLASVPVIAVPLFVFLFAQLTYLTLQPVFYYVLYAHRSRVYLHSQRGPPVFCF
jgi:hypothetical protein